MSGFSLALGKRRVANHSLRHEQDCSTEVLIDFDDDRDGLPLGFISVLHDIFSGKPVMWGLFDFNGDGIPGLSTCFNSKKEAMAAAHRFVTGLLEFAECNDVCVVCEGPILTTAETEWVHQVDGGGTMVAVDEDYKNEAADMGWWPMCPACAKDVPVEFRKCIGG